MSWQDIGFNENLSIADTEQQDQQLDPAQVEQIIPEMSGAKLSGLLKSQDGRLVMDLDNNTFIVTDGIIERVRLGQQSDGTYGLLIKDNNGNNLMSIGEKNIIQSPDKSLELNFDETQLLVRNEGGIPIILIGKQIGGF